jgi:hypothetical protein
VQPDGGETRYTQTSVLVGTAGYLAPERAQGGPPTAAADLFSLGCTLYYAVEGYGPFDRETGLAALTASCWRTPRPTLRAGALEPLLAAMLTKNPVHRITAEEAEGALSAIVTPQSHPRTRFDPGSEPPWAGRPTHTAAPRVPEPPPGPSQSHANGSQWYAPSAAQESSAAPGQETPATWPPPGQGPAPWPTGQGYGPPPATTSRRRPRHRVLKAVLATALGLALAGGGAWYAMAYLPGKGAGKPYGEVIGLSDALKDGDCVDADWRTGTPFTGEPGLKVVSCGDNDNEGQVMAVFEAASADAARTGGAAQCARRTDLTSSRLANVRSYAAVPTTDGFDAAGHRTACLVLGAHGPVYGPARQPPEAGGRVSRTRRPCRSGTVWTCPPTGPRELVSCAGKHDQVVLGFTPGRARHAAPGPDAIGRCVCPGRAAGRLRLRSVGLRGRLLDQGGDLEVGHTFRRVHRSEAERGHHGGQRTMRRVLRCPVPRRPWGCSP